MRYQGNKKHNPSMKNKKSSLAPAPQTKKQTKRQVEKINHAAALNKRTRGGQRNEQLPFNPPEDWHEPHEKPGTDYKIITQAPGKGYCHVLTTKEIRQRLSILPTHFIEPLEVVQLSRMTRKKQSFPCYGMQWGASVYLYPVEDTLIEFYSKAPNPNVFNETRMYGGRWEQAGRGAFKLIWSEKAIKDYYLNNILIHELGHLLDERNCGYDARERYAEWFAIEYGYRATQNSRKHGHKRRKKVIRRHSRK